MDGVQQPGIVARGRLPLCLAVWALSAFPAAALAQPTVTGITGTVSNNQVITISGSSFGTKTVAAPLVWEDFSDGLLDSKLVNHGPGPFFANGDNLRHPFSTKNARADYKNSGAVYFGYDAGTAPKWFVQYWIKLASNWHFGTSTFGGGDDGLANLKIFRMFPTGSRTYANVGYSLHGFAGGDLLRFVENGQSNYLGVDARNWFSAGVWHCVQVAYGENSGAGQSNGTMKLWIDGVLRDSVTNLDTNPTADGSAINKRPYIIGFYDSWSPADANVSNQYAYYADVYVDSSWSRIELGNAPTYASSTRREMLVPTVWSGTLISARVAQGGFTTGQTAYLYVVDANGQVNSNGFPVTIGGGGAGTAPRPPSNVKIIK